MFLPFCQSAYNKYLEFQWRSNYSPYVINIDWDQYFYNRQSIVNLLFSYQPNGNYLEIGCEKNQTFNSVIASNKVGVDPIQGGTHRLTSDEYFDLKTNEKFDVIFIDGLHTYEQVRRDLNNSTRSLNYGKGWIVLRDMLPRNWIEGNVQEISRDYWCGDIWKIAFELCKSTAIDFKIFKVDYGVCVLYISDSDKVKIPDLREQLSTQNYTYFYMNMNSLPIVEYDEGRNWILNILCGN